MLLFGSMLDESVSEVGDVDLAIEITRRNDVPETELRRRAHALRGDRRFSSYIDELTYPSVAATRFVKGRTPIFSLTHSSDGILATAPWRELYRRPGVAPFDLASLPPLEPED